jgi:hypothetical protein
MLRRTIAAEFFKASRRWGLLFWGFVFVPLYSTVIGLVLQLNSIHLDGVVPRIDLFSRLSRALEGSSSPIAQVFFIVAAATIFGSEYDSQNWRVLAPRARRMDWILAKVLLYAAGAFASLALIALGACFIALLGAVRLREPILWQARGVSPLGSIFMVFGISWFELLLLGLATGLIAVVSRSVLVGAISLILAAFCQTFVSSQVTASVSSIPLLAALPGLCADVARFFVTHTEVSPGEYIGSRTAMVASASLLVWTFLVMCLTLAWFRKQEFNRE